MGRLSKVSELCHSGYLARSLLCRDVAVVPEGTPSSDALDIIKNKKEDNVVVCNSEGNFVGALVAQAPTCMALGCWASRMLLVASVACHSP